MLALRKQATVLTILLSCRKKDAVGILHLRMETQGQHDHPGEHPLKRQRNLRLRELRIDPKVG